MKRFLRFCGVAVMGVLVFGLVFVTGAVVLNMRTPAATDLADSPQLQQLPPPISKSVTLKVVTYNLWDLYLHSDHRAERMPAIGEAVAALSPDIVGFQETWIASDRATVLAALDPIGLVHHHYFRSGLVGSGLLIVSRYPIVETHFWRYTLGGKPLRVDHGDWWAGKGVALARIELPDGAGYLDFFDTHAHASYGDRSYDPVRLSQMTELAAFVNEAATGTSPAIVVGDFNTRAGKEPYQRLVADADLDRLMVIDSRIDHIFAPRNAKCSFDVVETVPIKRELEQDGETFGISDHTGYMSIIRIDPAG
ncbi:MAG: hypothetical protein GY851_25010 [bacterium]|nr:hypothetical protein [bacterium]